MEQKMIDVGILTAGEPQMHKEGDVTVVDNVVIGIGFHWEQTVQCRFPGEMIPASENLRPFTLINRLPLETYLECVVGSEMNPEAPMEFLKAHAIVSRSWAAGKLLGRHNNPGDGSSSPVSTLGKGKLRIKDEIIDWEDNEDHDGFHLCNDDHCQRYQGLQPISAEARRAIADTSGIVIVDAGGELIDARFSKCCGGRTEVFSSCWQDEERAGLESFEDPWCDLSGMPEESRDALLSTVLKGYDRSSGGGYRWRKKVSGREIARLLNERYGYYVGEVSRLIPKRRGASGRIVALEIAGDKGSVTIGKELAIRRTLSSDCLYSSAFDVESAQRELAGDMSFQLLGYGWGHGVGMCQIGAANMALHGHSAEEILAFYYPGSCLRLLALG